MANPLIVWQNAHQIPASLYTCGYCGASVAPDKGWNAKPRIPGAPDAFIYLCHHCQGPTYIDQLGRQIPGTPFGDVVKDIDDDKVAALYEEARGAMTAGAYTAAVLCCRKILMHVAVANGAKEGGAFIGYVEHLSDKNYIPPNAKAWVDHIRKKSNEANHEVVLMSRVDAEELLSFTAMLRKVIYEFPGAMKKKTAAGAAPPSP